MKSNHIIHRSLLLMFMLYGFSVAEGKSVPLTPPPSMSYQQYRLKSQSHSVTPPSSEFFSLGTVPVFDASAIVNLIKTYDQLKTEYKKIKAKYELAVKMARYINNMEQRYKAHFSKLRRIDANHSLFQNTDAWIAGMNGEFANTSRLLQQVEDAYTQTGEELKHLDPDYIALLPDETKKRLEIAVASLELRDANNVRSLAAIAESTALATEINTKIDTLTNDSLSSSEDLNSQIAVLNKVNASVAMSLKIQRENTMLLMRLLEQTAIDSKMTRDSEAGRILQDQTIKTDVKQAILESCRGIDMAIRDFRY